MVPPVYHSLHRESIKNSNSAGEIGVKSVRPTWFEDSAVPKGSAPPTNQGQPQPLHGLKLVVKEEALPLKTTRLPSASTTGLTWLARAGHIEFQTGASQS